VDVAGDTMVGALSLIAANPTAGVHAAHKNYVDAQVATKLDTSAADLLYVSLTGDTMSGDLKISSAAPQLILNSPSVGPHAITAQVGDLNRWQMVLGTNDAATDFLIGRFDNAGTFIDSPLSISRSTGNISVPIAPSSALHVVNKAYADVQDALKVAKIGDTMTGALFLVAGAPTNPAHATRKDYVDGMIVGGTAVDSVARSAASAAQTTANNAVIRAGDTMTGALHLPTAAPTIGTQATNKTYVDTKAPLVHTHVIADVTGLQTALDAKLALAGGTMTGALFLMAGAPTNAAHATRKDYVDGLITGGTAVDSTARAAASAAQTTANNAVIRAGDTMVGALHLPAAAPTIGTQATNKTYVDAQVATKAPLVHTHVIGDVTGLQSALDAKLNLAGGTMTGMIDLPATAPTAAQAVRKDYVDAQVATKLDQTQGDVRYVEQAGDTMVGGLTISYAAPKLMLHSTGNDACSIVATNGANLIWEMKFGDNTGASPFQLQRIDASAIASVVFSISRLTGDAAFGGAPLAGSPLAVRGTGRGITLLNAAITTDVNIDIRFQTGLEASRARIRGQREALLDSGSLVFSTFAALVESDVLTLGSNKSALFGGEVLVPGLLRIFTPGDTQRAITFEKGNLKRWLIEGSSADAAADFGVRRYDDAGALLGSHVLWAGRATGHLTVNGQGNASGAKLLVQTDAASVTGSALWLNNPSSASNASVDLSFGSAGSTKRAVIRATRASANGSLSFFSMLGTTEVLHIALDPSGLINTYGKVMLAADPVDALQAATKQYVDAHSGGGGGGASVTISSTPPATPAVGDLWFDSNRLITFVSYDDGNSQQWVQSVPTSMGITQGDADARYVNLTGDVMTGGLAIPQATWLGLNGAAGTAGIIVDASSNFIFQIASGYYMARWGDTGNWAWTENNVANMTLEANGNFWTRGGASISGSISTGSHLYLNNNGQVAWAGGVSQIRRDSNGHFFLQPRSDYRNYWDHTDGAWRWQHGGSFELTDLTLGANGDLSARGNVYCGNVYTQGTIQAWMMQAPDGGRGQLKCANYGNHISFDWNGGYGVPYWIIDDGGAGGFFATANNARSFGYAGNTGGPHGVSLNGNSFDNTLWGIFVDAVSDERIKENITDTQVDALAVLISIPVRAFDIKAQYAAHFAGVGKTPEEQALIVPTPTPVAIGFVAQEVKALIPEAVNVLQQPEGSVLPADMHTIIQQNMVPYLVRAIQQQQEQIAMLIAEVVALKGAR
jgi:hypothetical protein